MGALTSRQNADVEESDVTANHAYRYPPKSGNYFGSHFIMGGERFDTPQPEAYLFGENADLNFLGSRPTVFPYPPPQTIEPTRTLKSLVNIRKESVRFTKVIDAITTVTDSAGKASGDSSAVISPKASVASATMAVPNTSAYNIEFVYDADAKCAITIYYFCTEEVTSAGCTYISREPRLTSETFHCASGVNQLFAQSSHVFRPHQFDADELTYYADRDVLPLVIHCVVEDGPDEPKQSHTTICVVDQHADGTFALRALKQKIFVDGLCYLLQEIYGIENKNIHKVSLDDDSDDNGSECVICMCDTRDTLILPCRHLCLCNSCADSLRFQANNCPICRAPFRALLQIKAVRRKGTLLGGGVGSSSNVPLATATMAAPAHSVASPAAPAAPALPGLPPQMIDNTPSGYVSVSLIEALNGPPQIRLPETKSDDIQCHVPDSLRSTEAAESLNVGKERINVDSSFEIPLSQMPANGGALSTTQSSKTGALSDSSAQQLLRSGLSAKIATKQQQQQLRDTLKIINEKLSAISSGDDATMDDADDDSDTEKLSPLLDKRPSDAVAAATDGNAPVDDDDDDAEQINQKTVSNKSTECLTASESGPAKSTPAANALLATALKEDHRSLPDSPISGNSTASVRSSNDSYSSGSSTRHLLATTNTPVQPPQQSLSPSSEAAVSISSSVAANGNASATSPSAVHV